MDLKINHLNFQVFSVSHGLPQGGMWRSNTRINLLKVFDKKIVVFKLFEKVIYFATGVFIL